MFALQNLLSTSPLLGVKQKCLQGYLLISFSTAEVRKLNLKRYEGNFFLGLTCPCTFIINSHEEHWSIPLSHFYMILYTSKLIGYLFHSGINKKLIWEVNLLEFFVSLPVLSVPIKNFVECVLGRSGRSENYREGMGLRKFYKSPIGLLNWRSFQEVQMWAPLKLLKIWD